jgi:hypothetical protein
MNERLKQLMQEAGYAAPELAGRAQKLAELLIKECASVVENLPEGYQDYRNQIEDAFRRDCISTMKEHYGVEE